MAQHISRGTQAGFTVIETVLFLAVTGALIAGLLGGIGIALNNQRYIDSVQSFKSLLQSQFSDLDTVANDRSDNWQCSSNAETSQSSTGSPVPRGQSDCFILGRYVVIDQGAVSMTDVIGTEVGGTTSGTGNDIDLLKANYHLNLSTAFTEVERLEWDTQIAWPKTGASDHDTPKSSPTPRALVILMIRSPTSGTVYTFTKDPVSDSELDPTRVGEADLFNMIKGGDAVPGQGDRLICLESNGLSTSGNTGFYIEAYATNSSAIQTRSNDTKVVGGTAEC